YKYRTTTMSIWNFLSNGNRISSYKKTYTSTTWNLDSTKISHADVNGDGREDLVALYNYGNANTGFWVFLKTASSYTAQRWWLSGKGAWNWSSTNLQVGDTNNDGKDDIVPIYKY
ncbi:MAG: VCBS repeat-containing protein, partial [Candidatus Pacebacteria bacterium]|nr:VCBS repeat-containing protein [Candidatus Paceibacterota bacterium]